MSWKGLVGHARDVAWELRRAGWTGSTGAFVCLDCPRDHLLPPYLAFGMCTHMRQHLRAHRDHRIVYWCVGDDRVEARICPHWNGDIFPDLEVQPVTVPERSAPVTQPATATGPAIGACTTCRAAVYLEPPGYACPFCGHYVANRTTFEDAAAAGTLPEPTPVEEGPSPAEPIEIPATCPHCQQEITIRWDGSLLDLVPPQGPGSAGDEAEPAATDETPIPSPVPDTTTDEPPETPSGSPSPEAEEAPAPSGPQEPAP